MPELEASCPHAIVHSCRAAGRRAPEIKKIAPVVRIAAAVLIENRRIAIDRHAHRLAAGAGGSCGEIGDLAEYDLVIVLAAIQADHEYDGAAQDGGSAHRTGGHVGALAEQGHRLDRFVAESAVPHHADERAVIETLGNLEHGIDPAQGDDVRNRARIDGGENGIDLARVLFVHGHADVQSRLTPTQAVHDLEAAHVSSHEQGAAAAVHLRTHQRLPLDRDVELLETLVDEIDAVVNGGGKAQDF